MVESKMLLMEITRFNHVREIEYLSTLLDVFSKKAFDLSHPTAF